MKRVGASAEPRSRSLGGDWDLFFVRYFHYLGDFHGTAGLYDDVGGMGGLEALVYRMFLQVLGCAGNILRSYDNL